MEACNFFYPLRAGFIEDGVPVKIANVIRIRSLISTNDRLDARRFSEMLRLGSFPESFIPDNEVQELRELVKLRHSFLQEVNQAQCRIWAILSRKGIKIKEKSKFSKRGFALVKKAAQSEKGDENLRFLINHYEYLVQSLAKATKNMTAYASRKFTDIFNKLCGMDGIADILASYIIAQVWPISRFSNIKKLRRYAGVIPVTQDSAGKSYGNRIPKTSSRTLLRWAFVQAGIAAIKKKDSKLREYYKLKKKTKGIGAIMCIARVMSDKVFRTLQC